MIKIIKMLKEKISKKSLSEELEEALMPCCPAHISKKSGCSGILGECSPCTDPVKYKNCAGYIAHVNHIEVNYK
jgi:hypothetical protein